MNVKKIQIAMIKYYGISDLESEGLLKFVMKLDEAQTPKSQKLERISISLMNGPLIYSN